jgi:hypothetical protein
MFKVSFNPIKLIIKINHHRLSVPVPALPFIALENSVQFPPSQKYLIHNMEVRFKELHNIQLHTENIQNNTLQKAVLNTFSCHYCLLFYRQWNIEELQESR